MFLIVKRLRSNVLIIVNIFISFILVLMILALFLHLAPVSFDAGACAGGYKTHLVNIEMETLNRLIDVSRQLPLDNSSSITLDPQELATNMTWEDRLIRTKAVVNIRGREFVVYFEGKRYWIEKYKWKISRIVSEVPTKI